MRIAVQTCRRSDRGVGNTQGLASVGRISSLAALTGLLAAALAAGSLSAQTAGCEPPAAAKLVFDGVTSRVDEVLYVSPKTALTTEPANAASSWFVDGTAVAGAALPSPWPAGAHAVLVTATDSCGQPARLAEEQFVVDGVAPQLEWKVVNGEELAGKIPNQGSDKRYLWWWMQPAKRRLVWSDGSNAWSVLRQYPDTRVETAPARSTLYVWAPDDNPFDGSENESARLEPQLVLVVSATDDASGVSAVDLRVLTADDGSLKLVVSAVDRVGNSAEVELPYRIRK